MKTEDRRLGEGEVSDDFSSLGLREELLTNVYSLGYTKMTPIQARSLPPILEGKDVIGQGKTGSGKTAAFGLGVLTQLDVENRRTQALVVCPTRELVDQVTQSIRQLARTVANVKVISLCGGMPMRVQLKTLEHGAHIVVGTPGRICKHLRKETLRIDSLGVLVLDEGDRMLEMGFQDEVDLILDHAPLERQTLLFSATFPDEIQSIADEVMDDPVRVAIDVRHDAGSIEQVFYRLAREGDRLDGLLFVLGSEPVESTVVFCKTKLETEAVKDALLDVGYDALALHGDLGQRERDEALIRFSNRSASVLVATDVAARGLDIESLDRVINYQLPRDPEVYVHRVGRTGRAGARGVAGSFFGQWDELKKDEIFEYVEGCIAVEELPESSSFTGEVVRAGMVTLVTRIGCKQKFRPGNLLGALTGENGIEGSQVGKINVGDEYSYVAVDRSVLNDALRKLKSETWRGRAIRAWVLT